MERRDFMRKTLISGAGIAAVALQGANNQVFANVRPSIFINNDAKKVFREKGACSHTMCFIVNREFGNNNNQYERATDLLAGGLAMTGHQCGMLWGSVMAAGTEAYSRYSNKNEAIETTVAVSQKILQSFTKCAGSSNCRDITDCNFNNPFDMMGYMAKIMFTGMDNNVCFVMAEKWAPEVVKVTVEGLALKAAGSQPVVSCASELVRKMGGSEKEMVMVSGYAGGLALSGNACGALAASIWMKMLKWQSENPDKTPKYLNNPVKKRILKAFYAETKKEILCSKICGRSIFNLNDHTQYIQQGGCNKLIERLANA